MTHDEAGLSRRAFLVAAAGVGVAAAAGAGAWRLLEGGENLEPIRRVGRAYLAAHPDEASLDALFARSPALRGGDLGGRLAYLRARVARDFREGAVVPVSGWRLSVTEARAAAALALLTAG